MENTTNYVTKDISSLKELNKKQKEAIYKNCTKEIFLPFKELPTILDKPEGEGK